MANMSALILLLPAVAFALMAFFAADDFAAMVGLSSYPVVSYAFAVLFFAACVLFAVGGIWGAIAA